MIGRTNAVSKPGVELSLVVSVTTGATVTATKGSKTVSGTAAGGSCVLALPEAGTWSVKATYNGQTSDTKSVSVVDSYAVALTFFSATITVNVDSGASVVLKKGGVTLQTKTSTGTAVFTVTETGTYTVEATKNSQTVSGSVNVVSGTTSYTLTLSFVSSTLNNNEWSVIKSVSDAGQGANYWSVGDRKAVTLNGTVGKLTLSNFTTYAFIIGFNHMASTAITTYRGRLEYELGDLDEADFADEAAYLAAVEQTRGELASDIAASFLSTLPEQVSDALEEIGQADLYTLIVGSIFYKLAGLLLPIIYMIMASNNLISGQVDSGSMAYVLSTSTRRGTVVFTQAVYLLGSLLAMFGLTTATGCVCLSLITEEVELTAGKLVLLNAGAFLVLLALSGLCFFTSCVFDRSGRSMAIGGGLSIFALVAAMLGLFGSPVIPSVVRLDALNHFNDVTVISLFDVISIIEGTTAYQWKFAILAAAGLVGYLAGSVYFTKKDLPL